MAHGQAQTVKTTMLFEKGLLEEIDRFNPFPTRKAFLEQACRSYMRELKRRKIDQELELACAEAGEEDAALNEEWESATLEAWK